MECVCVFIFAIVHLGAASPAALLGVSVEEYFRIAWDVLLYFSGNDRDDENQNGHREENVNNIWYGLRVRVRIGIGLNDGVLG